MILTWVVALRRPTLPAEGLSPGEVSNHRPVLPKIAARLDNPSVGVAAMLERRRILDPGGFWENQGSDLLILLLSIKAAETLSAV